MSTRRNTNATMTVAGLVLLAAAVSPLAGSLASYTASTTDQAAEVAIGNVLPPTNLTATLSGDDVVLDWAAGTVVGAAPGYRVRRMVLVEPDVKDGHDEPTGCDVGATFPTSNQVRLAAGVLTHTDAAAGSTTTSGQYRCYQVEAEYPATSATARWWSLANNPVVLVQTGHAIKTITAVDGGTPGVLRPGDQFVFTFIQPVDTTTGPVDTGGGNPPTTGNDICVRTDQSVVMIARQTSLNDDLCTQTHSNLLARLINVTQTAPAVRRNGYHADYEWSNCPVANECLTLTATVGALHTGTDDTTSATLNAATTTINPSAFVTTALRAASNDQALCTGSNSTSRTCRPIATGSL